MADWKKLNKEFNDLIERMTDEDWKVWYEMAQMRNELTIKTKIMNSKEYKLRRIDLVKQIQHISLREILENNVMTSFTHKKGSPSLKIFLWIPSDKKGEEVDNFAFGYFGFPDDSAACKYDVRILKDILKLNYEV